MASQWGNNSLAPGASAGWVFRSQFSEDRIGVTWTKAAATGPQIAEGATHHGFPVGQQQSCARRVRRVVFSKAESAGIPAGAAGDADDAVVYGQSVEYGFGRLPVLERTRSEHDLEPAQRRPVDAALV